MIAEEFWSDDERFRARRRDHEEATAQAWKDLHNIPVTPERRVEMEQFEKDLFGVELPQKPEAVYHLNVSCDEIISDEEADQIVDESRINKR